MKVSIVVSTRNRSHAIVGCLDSIVASLQHAKFLDAEIIVVDNGSTDDTGTVIQKWVSACPYPAQALTEHRKGLSRAQNTAIRASSGDLFAFTDDDCRLHLDYINDLLRYDASDTDLVIRGGRIELGDPSDMPVTINTNTERQRWTRAMKSARSDSMSGKLNGCNMTMRRGVFERIGYFDEEFGSGAPMTAGGDTEFFYRAYVAGIALEFVPDMAVSHFHGRNTVAAANKLWRSYMFGEGAIYVRYLFLHSDLVRPFYWDIKNAIKEMITGTNTFLPDCNFSHRDKIFCALRGAFHYVFLRRDRTAYRPTTKQLARLL